MSVHLNPYPAKRFASIDQARVWVQHFVVWYNTEYTRSGIRFVTPALRHAGLDRQILARRTGVYKAARRAHPARWRSRSVRNWEHISMVSLNLEKIHQNLPGKVRLAAVIYRTSIVTEGARVVSAGLDQLHVAARARLGDFDEHAITLQALTSLCNHKYTKTCHYNISVKI